ncbi:hypothetical protein KSF78_0008573 [Schistosoma japonicum]|nr:hypothetical protein KSF78_0008573 [Schistosoma japonicum]
MHSVISIRRDISGSSCRCSVVGDGGCGGGVVGSVNGFCCNCMCCSSGSELYNAGVDDYVRRHREALRLTRADAWSTQTQVLLVDRSRATLARAVTLGQSEATARVRGPAPTAARLRRQQCRRQRQTSRGVTTDTSRRVEHTDTSVVSGPITSDTSASSDTRTIRSDSTSSRTSTDSSTTTTTTMPPATTLGTMLMTSTSSSTAATAFANSTSSSGLTSTARSESSTTISTTVSTTAMESINIGIVYTQFRVKGVLSNSRNREYIPWSDDYNNYQSILYINLANIFRNLIIDSLLTANSQIFQGARCTIVIFIRITIFIRSKRQIVSSPINSTSIDGIQGSATVELQTLSGSQLSQDQFTELLTDGYNQLNKSSGALLNNVQATRITPVLTCSSTQLICGDHASCRNTENGVQCTCDPMWKDTTPSDPGKHCTLHPGTIALIVFAGILLLLAIIAIIYFVIKTKSMKKFKLKTIS